MGSGIAPGKEPEYIGKCDYCGQEVYSDMEHYEMPDGELYCCADCLLYAMDDYHVWGVID